VRGRQLVVAAQDREEDPRRLRTASSVFQMAVGLDGLVARLIEDEVHAAWGASRRQRASGGRRLRMHEGLEVRAIGSLAGADEVWAPWGRDGFTK
jgi:hypothetical protein